MSDEFLIFDRALVDQRRNRAAPAAADHDFLLRRTAEDLELRLSAVVRNFDRTLVLGAHHGVMRERLDAADTVGQVIEMERCGGLLRPGRRSCIQADEEFLPFPDASLDLVVAPLTLQYVNDLPGVLIQIRRALRPDGLFLGAIMGGRTLTELREALATAETEVRGGVSPRVSPFADIRELGSLLQRAGYALPVVDSDPVTVTYDTAFHLMRDLRGMGAANALTLRDRTPTPRGLFTRMAEVYGERFSEPGGRIRATFEIIYVTGWTPHASQPKPLRPGSAKTRLADALGTVEQSLGEKADPKNSG